jgi:hypothetical protein
MVLHHRKVTWAPSATGEAAGFWGISGSTERHRSAFGARRNRGNLFVACCPPGVRRSHARPMPLSTVVRRRRGPAAPAPAPLAGAGAGSAAHGQQLGQSATRARRGPSNYPEESNHPEERSDRDTPGHSASPERCGVPEAPVGQGSLCRRGLPRPATTRNRDTTSLLASAEIGLCGDAARQRTADPQSWAGHARYLW